jgi:hypothetical protein
VGDNIINDFIIGKRLGNLAAPRQGLATTNNDRFVRCWHEVVITNTLFMADKELAQKSGRKWFPYNKGGAFRKWYGNSWFVVNWWNDGYDIKEFLIGKNPNVARGEQHYFKKSISWSKVSSGNAAFRYFPPGYIFDVAGCSIFYENEKHFNYIFAYLNSNTNKTLLSSISPTLNFEAGQIQDVPIIFCENRNNEIDEIVNQNVSISSIDWDSFETSWDFKRHPLI